MRSYNYDPEITAHQAEYFKIMAEYLRAGKPLPIIGDSNAGPSRSHAAIRSAQARGKQVKATGDGSKIVCPLPNFRRNEPFC